MRSLVLHSSRLKTQKGLVSEQVQPQGFLSEKLREANVSEKGIISLLGDRVMPKGYNNFLDFIASKERKEQQ